jgi:hypothetical protein
MEVGSARGRLDIEPDVSVNSVSEGMTPSMAAAIQTKHLVVSGMVLGITGFLAAFTPALGAAPAAPATEHAGAHILLAYKGAERARPDVKRTKEEAKKRALALLVILRKQPARFAELAKLHSDCPSGAKGGVLGKWLVGRMVPEFDAVIARMKIGEIFAPVETPFGLHVIRRDDPALVK